MSSYDNYDDGGRSDYSSARYYDDRRYQRDPRYAESRDSYSKSHTASRDLVPRTREDSEYGVEEIRRDFPPPTYSKDAYREYDDDRYSRSGRDRGFDRHESKKSSRGTAYYEEEKKRRRVLSNQEKIMAAVIGGALAVGGKELFDRREAKQDGHGIQRNALSSAALGAAGAFAAYQGADLYSKHSGKEDKKALVAQKGRGGVAYYSDDDSDSEPRNKKGHKNFLESALAAAGLGGAVSALRGGSEHEDKGSDTRSRRGDSRSGSRSRSRSGSRSASKGAKPANRVQKAAMASLIAGATEAFRVAKEPGGWQGEKAKRIFTAAATAGTIDAAHDDKHTKLGLAESVIGGLLGNRIVNGSRRNIEEDKHTGRSRSRSRARSEGGGGSGSNGVSGLAALATAGLGALGAKKIASSHERSRSRRRQSADSYGSRTRSRDRSHRSRSRSVVDTARRGLAKLGIGNDADDSDHDRDASIGHKSGSSRRHRRRDSAGSRDDYRSSDRRRGGGGDRDRDFDRSRDRSHGRSDRDEYGDKARSSGRRDRRKDGADHSSDSDLGSSSEDEKKEKKMKGKQVITTGLAAVAAIHAAHSVYQSMEKRRSRQKAVREGKMSPEDAKKLKQKALLQDAAAVGIAALGINGALSEVKEAREVSHKMKEWHEEKARRHQRRLERQLGARAAATSGESRTEHHDDERRVGNGDPYAALPAPAPTDEDGAYYDRDSRYY